MTLLLAVTLDLALGDPPNRLHPVAWLGAALDAGRRRLCRGPAWALLAGGAALTVAVAALAGAVGAGVSALAARLGPAGPALEAVALACLFSLRDLARAAREVAGALDAGDLEGARRAVARHLVSRPTGELDAGRVASAAVESVAENLTDSFVAPVCFYLAFGLAGAAAYRALNTADAMLGYRAGALEWFGKAAARLDDLANLVPARLAGLGLVAGAALAGEDAPRALAALRRERRATASPNAGWTMAAMAGALGVTLEKPGAYRLGRGPLPGPAEIERALRVFGLGALSSGAAALLLRGLATMFR
ncbi:MAG TPA: cobalamin biosynthesis protein CobD [Candidatus Rokubacteria bacterium]|nr:cobalamin biosynthesis protein CobD [Candidatus Rokubacteria bacterium]